MIAEITLRGFQSHVNSTFNLQNGLNVITGPSDAGKTAIIRAIRWVAFNEPQGEAFVNENVGEAEAAILLQNGNIITKRRRKGKTTYIIQESENGIESVFEKSEVPLEVTRLLGIEKTSFGDFEAALNFSFQLDAPFLISETASAGAKVLGKLAGTESVDLAIKGVSKDTHATRNMRSQAEKDIERILASLFEYQHIDDAKQSLETAEMIFNQVERDYEKLSNLKEYRHTYLLSKNKMDKLDEKIKQLQHVTQLIEYVSQIEKDQQRNEQLIQLQDDRTRLESRISSLEIKLESFKDVTLASDLVKSIEEERDRLTNITILRQSYQNYTQDVKIADETLEKTKDLKQAEETLNSIEIMLNSLHDLRNTKAEYETIQHELNVLETKFEAFRGIHEIEFILTAVERDEKRLTVLKELQKEYSMKNGIVKMLDKRLNEYETEMTAAKEKLEKAWEEAGGVCPLCEQAHEGRVC